MDAKTELLNGITDLVQRLEALEVWCIDLQRTVMELQVDVRAIQAARAASSPNPVEIAITPGTAAQGFLAARWQRRDGTVYGPTATEADAEINSAIKGGDESAIAQSSRRNL